jgi:uncharacterized cupredoxin-like copper-binding protein
MSRVVAYFLAFTGMGSLFIAMLLLAAVVLGGTNPAGAGASPSPSSAPTSGGPVGTIEITAMNLAFTPTEVAVEEPGRYEVVLVNHDGVLHDITFADGTVITAEANATGRGVVEVPAAGLSFLCSVPGHADAGMVGGVSIGPAPSASVGELMTAEEMRDVDAAVTARFPEETEGLGGQLLEPEILADGTKVFELTASVI